MNRVRLMAVILRPRVEAQVQPRHAQSCRAQPNRTAGNPLFHCVANDAPESINLRPGCVPDECREMCVARRVRQRCRNNNDRITSKIRKCVRTASEGLEEKCELNGDGSG